MPSYLTFASTQQFRDRLLTRNLEPYSVPGGYSGPPITEIIRETNLSDYSVINSPDNLISEDPFADLLYPLNAYGPLGGYNKNINIGGLANTRSNLGPYDYNDAKLLDNSRTIQLDIPRTNRYASTNPLNSVTLGNIQSVPTFQGYADPLNFTPSTYTNYSIILNDNPSGSNGTLSQDSYIAQLGAKELRRNFQWRIAREIERNTIGRINLLNAIGNPERAILIASGREPLIEKNWTITRPSNFIFRAADFLAKLQGYQFPVSVIPGDYFAQPQNNLSLFGQIAKAFNGGKDPRLQFDEDGNAVKDSGFAKLFGRTLSKPDGSQLFLNNTGSGQKSQLFFNLSMNRYGPNYNKSLFNEIIDGARDLINNALDNPPTGQYYVGSKQLDASFINSPAGDIPIDPWGRAMQSPVYGPDKLAINFEGERLNNFPFGFKGVSSQDGGDMSGGFIYTSQKYNIPGKTQREGGGSANKKIQENLPLDNSTKSFGFDFKESSILDNTQRIVDSTPEGKNRLKHAGNAINQLSKVFDDGYKEITKGSKVIYYTWSKDSGTTTDNVYCRVFAKDLPYYSNDALQKTDGNIRKFNYSVLDATYNLNIAPGKTNIENGKVKKYMFSLENLAWRTSKRAGLTYDDLPACEKGPNGGRIMWFPPYDIKFNETSTATFRGQDFLGRPEPIYTYSNTKRSGTLSWKIIVDHPSILNLIAQKELKNNSVDTNKIIESFMAGCLKYDIYELAKKWNQIPLKDLYILQKTINQKPPTIETITDVITDSPIYTTIETTQTSTITVPDFNQYLNYGYFFENDSPDPNTRSTTTTSNWGTLYNEYVSKQSQYIQSSGQNAGQTDEFFNTAIIYNHTKTEELIQDLYKYFQEFEKDGQSKPTVTITLVGTASAISSVNYNKTLSQRRISSVENYIKNSTILSQYRDQISIKYDAQGELSEVSTVTSDGGSKAGINCTNQPINTTYDRIYSIPAMACRKVTISSIDAQKPEPKTTKTTTQQQTNVGATSTNTTTKITTFKPEVSTQEKLREGVSKYILRMLLNECDYFQTVEEINPMFTGLLKEKLKYFHPAFHSITPEGLNSRLTFLQQCMRPGDTIPTIKNGEEVYDDARNTAFGAPPVLVLRIGDFFNTKIIPQSLNITYEPLHFDLNPEGIGVQPMLANISLNFEIIGGEGLKGPIDKLQNALSFNFYANTEMYDERADPTDPSYQKIDAELIDYIEKNPPAAGPKDSDENLQNEAGLTIGTIQSSNVTTTGTTGTITYQKIMDDLLDSGQSYIDIFYGKSKQIVEDYNTNLFTYFTLSRLYNKGKFREWTSPQNLEILGKINNINTDIGYLYSRILKDVEKVESKTDPGNFFIQQLYGNNLPNKVIKVIKKNFKKLIYEQRDKVIDDLSFINQKIAENEIVLNKILRKIDFVDTLSDGFIRRDQSVQIYNLSATTEVAQGSTATNTYQELTIDYTSAGNKLYSFYNRYSVSYGWIRTDGISPQNFLDNLDSYEDNEMNTDRLGGTDTFQSEKRFFMGFCDIILNDVSFEDFKSQLLPSDFQGPQWNTARAVINEVYDKRKIAYKKEKQKQIETFNAGITEDYKKDYQKWEPYLKGKIRKFEYSNLTPKTTTQEERLVNIYKDGNSNTDNKTFNGKNQFL
jgi:hypothetical protein